MTAPARPRWWRSPASTVRPWRRWCAGCWKRACCRASAPRKTSAPMPWRSARRAARRCASARNAADRAEKALLEALPAAGPPEIRQAPWPRSPRPAEALRRRMAAPSRRKTSAAAEIGLSHLRPVISSSAAHAAPTGLALSACCLRRLRLPRRGFGLRREIRPARRQSCRPPALRRRGSGLLDAGPEIAARASRAACWAAIRVALTCMRPTLAKQG